MSSMARFLFLLVFAVLLVGNDRAQSFPGTGPSDGRQPDGTLSSERRTLLGSPEDEMLKKREFRLLEKSHQETVERSREVARLGSELREAYEHSQAFSRGDVKKLERLEKVTRHIRSDAGGSEGETPTDKKPQDIQSAVSRLAKLSEEIQKAVEKTPRQVVSAVTIEKANELLGIARFLRQNLH